MKVKNTGNTSIKLIANGNPLEIKAGSIAEIDSRTFEVLKKMFSLVAVEETVIEAEPQAIETKAKEKKNGKSKKSK